MEVESNSAVDKWKTGHVAGNLFYLFVYRPITLTKHIPSLFPFCVTSFTVLPIKHIMSQQKQKLAVHTDLLNISKSKRTDKQSPCRQNDQAKKTKTDIVLSWKPKQVKKST